MGTKIKVVGFDPSLRNWGIARAVIDLESLAVTITGLELVSTDSLTTKQVRRNCDDVRRAALLHGGMVLGCTGAKLAFVETPVGSQSARAMASYGVCVGVLGSCPIPLIQVLPHEVKLAAVGHKQAAKEEMIEWAHGMHPEANWITRKLKGVVGLTAANEHLADAVAAIYAGLQTDQFLQVRSMLGGMTQEAA